jgi:hypothetical protein
VSDLPPMEISVIPETQEEVDLAVLKVINADKFLVSTDNLSDLDDAEEARFNLGIGDPADYATSAQGQLAELHRLGFKTFDPWINENYDLESNPECRFDMIKEEITRLSAMSMDELHIVLDNIDQIAEYNKKNYSLLLDQYLLEKA